MHTKNDQPDLQNYLILSTKSYSLNQEVGEQMNAAKRITQVSCIFFT